MTYKDATGDLFASTGEWLGRCYSGHGSGINNVAEANVPNVGPIPPAIYSAGDPTDHIGPLTFPLTLEAGNEFGRSGFYIHGDNAAMNHSASEGCIVASHDIRLRIAARVAAGDRTLEVV